MSFVSAIIVSALVGAITLFWSRMNYRHAPLSDAEGSGTITPGKVSAAIVTLFGILLSIFGVASIVYGLPFIGAICLILGLALTIFMGFSLIHVHDVSWDQTAVYGPCKLFGPSLGLNRTIVRWDEIATTGKTVTSYWFIEARDGRRIYWSYLYPGYGKFVERLRQEKPLLMLPDDLC